MPSTATLLTFGLTAIILVIIPGPNVLFVVSRGIDQGRTAALVSSFGIETATFVHIAAAMLGLSAAVTSSELVFDTIKYAGIAYLLWLGWHTIRMGAVDAALMTGFRRAPLKRLYFQGMIVNLLNVKVALFMFAFLPQFIDPARGDARLQILVLGLLFVTVATISDGLYALASGSIGNWLTRHHAASRQRGRFAGSMYFLLGILALFSGSGTAQQA